MKKAPSTKAATPAIVSAFLASVDADLERLRGLLVERGQFATDLKILADKAALSVTDAKRDIGELERIRALVASGQAQPDNGGAVAVR